MSGTHLRADCANCFGLCCTALRFQASASFAIDKPAGTPCPNLLDDFRCGIHQHLRAEGFSGCTVWDCFGAGQHRLADCLGADLHDARLAGANLTGALFLTQPQVDSAIGDARTLLPAGLERPPHWS
jgi:hypothetical protein